MAECLVEPKRDPQVVAQVRRVYNAIDNLKEVVAATNTRLVTVLKSAPKDLDGGTPVSKVQENLVPLADELRGMEEQIYEQASNLSTMLILLEL